MIKKAEEILRGRGVQRIAVAVSDKSAPLFAKLGYNNILGKNLNNQPDFYSKEFLFS